MSWPSPPARTPIASARMGGSTRAARRSTPAIIPRFSIAGPIAPAKKWPCAFRTPVASAASPTSTRYGNIARVRSVARAACAGSDAKPGAITWRIHGAARIPSSVVSVSASSASARTARSMRRSSRCGRVTVYSLKTGIMAVESAPSARSRRRMFGIRKATKNASVTGPAPKVRATIMSRAKPAIRETSVAPPIAPRAWTTWRSGAFTLKSPRRSGMMQRGPETGSKERRRGEHEVLDQAHPAERAAPAPQPRHSHGGAHRREGGPRGRGRGAQRGDPWGHSRPRQGRLQGRHPRQHSRPQEVRTRPPPRGGLLDHRRGSRRPPPGHSQERLRGRSPRANGAYSDTLLEMSRVVEGRHGSAGASRATRGAWGSPHVQGDDRPPSSVARPVARPAPGRRGPAPPCETSEELGRRGRQTLARPRAVHRRAGDVGRPAVVLGAHEVAEVVVGDPRDERVPEQRPRLALDLEPECRLELAGYRHPGRAAQRDGGQLGVLRQGAAERHGDGRRHPPPGAVPHGEPGRWQRHARAADGEAGTLARPGVVPRRARGARELGRQAGERRLAVGHRAHVTHGAVDEQNGDADVALELARGHAHHIARQPEAPRPEHHAADLEPPDHRDW